MSGVELLLSDAHGIYIPKLFLESFLSFKVWGLLKSDFKVLRNPDNEYYWDKWGTCLKNTVSEHSRTLHCHVLSPCLFANCSKLAADKALSLNDNLLSYCTFVFLTDNVLLSIK